jgi:alkylated DNA repair dioxygenase AlkB
MSVHLCSLRDRVSEITGLAFNTVLVNLYRDGRDSMGWHADDDYPHGGQPALASLSLGATRRFRFRSRQPQRPRATFGMDLNPGSLLVIDGEARTDWQHALPRTARPIGPRVNLTFRHMSLS